MYEIGDKVVYPMHGAGVIESIEDKDILGETHKYYTLKLSLNNMKLMIPMLNCDKTGLRPIISKDRATEVLEELKNYLPDPENNWSKRYKTNALKIKTGNISDVMTVVKGLMFLDKIKGLSTSERKMLNNAKQIFESEIHLALEMSIEEIEDIINNSVMQLN